MNTINPNTTPQALGFPVVTAKQDDNSAQTDANVALPVPNDAAGSTCNPAAVVNGSFSANSGMNTMQVQAHVLKRLMEMKEPQPPRAEGAPAGAVMRAGTALPEAAAAALPPQTRSRAATLAPTKTTSFFGNFLGALRRLFGVSSAKVANAEAAPAAAAARAAKPQPTPQQSALAAIESPFLSKRAAAEFDGAEHAWKTPAASAGWHTHGPKLDGWRTLVADPVLMRAVVHEAARTDSLEQLELMRTCCAFVKSGNVEDLAAIDTEALNVGGAARQRVAKVVEKARAGENFSPEQIDDAQKSVAEAANRTWVDMLIGGIVKDAKANVATAYPERAIEAARQDAAKAAAKAAALAADAAPAGSGPASGMRAKPPGFTDADWHEIMKAQQTIAARKAADRLP